MVYNAWNTIYRCTFKGENRENLQEDFEFRDEAIDYARLNESSDPIVIEVRLFVDDDGGIRKKEEEVIYSGEPEKPEIEDGDITICKDEMNCESGICNHEISEISESDKDEINEELVGKDVNQAINLTKDDKKDLKTSEKATKDIEKLNENADEGEITDKELAEKLEDGYKKLTEGKRIKQIEITFHYVLGYDNGDHTVYWNMYDDFEDELNSSVQKYSEKEDANRDIYKANAAWVAVTHYWDSVDEFVEDESTCGGFHPIEIIDNSVELPENYKNRINKMKNLKECGTKNISEEIDNEIDPETECSWCHDTFPKSQLNYINKDWGYLCDHCKDAIEAKEGKFRNLEPEPDNFSESCKNRRNKMKNLKILKEENAELSSITLTQKEAQEIFDKICKDSYWEKRDIQLKATVDEDSAVFFEVHDENPDDYYESSRYNDHHGIKEDKVADIIYEGVNEIYDRIYSRSGRDSDLPDDLGLKIDTDTYDDHTNVIDGEEEHGWLEGWEVEGTFNFYMDITLGLDESCKNRRNKMKNLKESKVPFDKVDDLVEVLNNFINDYAIVGARVTTDYSGRFMYGASCVGIIIPKEYWPDLYSYLGDNLNNTAEINLKKDNMGLNMIYYFPDYSYDGIGAEYDDDLDDLEEDFKSSLSTLVKPLSNSEIKGFVDKLPEPQEFVPPVFFKVGYAKELGVEIPAKLRGGRGSVGNPIIKIVKCIEYPKVYTATSYTKTKATKANDKILGTSRHTGEKTGFGFDDPTKVNKIGSYKDGSEALQIYLAKGATPKVKYFISIDDSDLQEVRIEDLKGKLTPAAYDKLTAKPSVSAGKDDFGDDLFDTPVNRLKLSGIYMLDGNPGHLGKSIF